jgi:two-component system response regulator DevR
MTDAETKRIRIVLAEDHEIVRAGLKNLLERFPQIEVVGESGSVRATIDLIRILKPDVVLLDLSFPVGTGFDVCREIQASELDTRVLILTSVADDETIFRAISAGADGYLLKEVDPEGLVRAIENVAAGKSILDPTVTRRVFGRINSGETTTKDELASLSPQERRVLALVAEGKTNKEIGLLMGLSDKTVKNYLSNVLDKLKVSRRSQAAAFYAQRSPH